MAELELEPLGALELDALPLPLAAGWSADGAADELDEDDGAGADEEPDDCGVVEPEAAEPLMLEEPEGAGAALDEDDEPPEAWSFFWISIEVDEELEPEPEGAALGAAVVPEAELEDEPGAAVLPDGEVVVDELDEAGVRGVLSPQPARTVAPNAMETASAIVESFMRPPWLGQERGSKDRAVIIKPQSSCLAFH